MEDSLKAMSHHAHGEDKDREEKIFASVKDVGLLATLKIIHQSQSKECQLQ